MNGRKRSLDCSNVVSNSDNIVKSANSALLYDAKPQCSANEDLSMDIDNEMVMSDEENGGTSQVQVNTVGDEKPSVENVVELTTYSDAAYTWLGGLKWKPYPPSLLDQTLFLDYDDNYEDADPCQNLLKYYSDYAAESDFSGTTLDSNRVPSPTLQPNFDHREFIFTMLQTIASTTRSHVGPLTLEAVSSLSSYSATLIDDALSGDDERIRNALVRLFGDLHTGDTVIGELIDERRWDSADQISAECVFTMVNRVAQHNDFYAFIPNNTDPVFSMTLAETDWLLYEMVSYVCDEHADMSLYDEHFHGPTVDDKRNEKALLQRKKLKQDNVQPEAVAPQSTVSAEVYPAIIASMVQEQQHQYGYPYMPILPEAVDPASLGADYWLNYHDCQQQAAFVQAAAYSYTVKQRAQYAMASYAMATQYQQPVPQMPAPSQQQPQNKNTSMAVKFVKSALKTKTAASENNSTSATSSQRTRESELKNKDVLDKYTSDNYHSSKGESGRGHTSKRDESKDRRDGPFYCMVTNLRNNSKASDIEKAARDIGRIESVKVLRDKAAQPPDNALAAITFRYVYKTAFDKLLSKGLYYAGKHRPIAKLSSDPFASSKD